MKIAQRTIDSAHPPYVIAEIGVNHDGMVDRAVALGARLIVQNDRSAILVDPNRAEFAVGTWALETDRITKEPK